eukprot:UC4_evm2s1211
MSLSPSSVDPDDILAATPLPKHQYHHSQRGTKRRRISQNSDTALVGTTGFRGSAVKIFESAARFATKLWPFPSTNQSRTAKHDGAPSLNISSQSGIARKAKKRKRHATPLPGVTKISTRSPFEILNFEKPLSSVEHKGLSNEDIFPGAPSGPKASTPVGASTPSLIGFGDINGVVSSVKPVHKSYTPSTSGSVIKIKPPSSASRIRAIRRSRERYKKKEGERRKKEILLFQRDSSLPHRMQQSAGLVAKGLKLRKNPSSSDMPSLLLNHSTPSKLPHKNIDAATSASPSSGLMIEEDSEKSVVLGSSSLSSLVQTTKISNIPKSDDEKKQSYAIEFGSEWIEEKMHQIRKVEREMKEKKAQIEEELARVALEDDHVIFPSKSPKKDVFAPLSPDAQQLVDNAFDNSRDLQEVLVSSKQFGTTMDFDIKREDTERLNGLNWLNDNIINYYLNLIMIRSHKKQDIGSTDSLPAVWCHKTQFLSLYESGGYKKVRRWTKKCPNGGDIFSQDVVIVPVHLGSHWCCGVINIKAKRFEYYDSMNGGGLSFFSTIRKYVDEEHSNKKGTHLDLSDWVDYCPNDTPQQGNFSDCGVFTCKFAEYVSRGAPFTFSQADMPEIRRSITYEILTNKLLDPLKEKCAV